MQFLVCVINSVDNPAHPQSEMDAINALNVEMVEKGHRVIAAGIEGPEHAKQFDKRSGELIQTNSSINSPTDYLNGFWILDVPDQETAEDYCRKAAFACNRKIELRKFL